MRDDYAAFYNVACIALVVIAIGVWAIARWSIARAKPRRDEDDAIFLGIGSLYFWTIVEILLYSAYFWVFRDWLSAKDIPKMIISLLFMSSAFSTSYLVHQRSTRAFIPFTMHSSLLLLIFLNTRTIGYPHLLNLMYTILASFFLFSFSISGYFNQDSAEKPKRDAGNQNFPIEKMLVLWSNRLLLVASLYLIIYLVDFSFHFPRIPGYAYLYMLVSVVLAYLSAFLFRKAFVLALLPTAASIFLFGFYFVRMPVTYPFYLNMVVNLIVLVVMVYFLARIGQPKPSAKQKRHTPMPSPQLSKPVPIGSMLKPQAASPKPQSGRATPAQFMRHTLFGDLPLEEWAVVETDVEPWASFLRAKKAVAANNPSQAILELRNVLKQPKLESRQYLEAWHALRQLGVQPSAEESKHVYGFIMETNTPRGLEILAVYEDCSARHYPAEGGGIIHDPQPDHSYPQIDKLMAEASIAVATLKPINGERPAIPKQNEGHLLILTPSGYHIAYSGLQVNQGRNLVIAQQEKDSTVLALFGAVSQVLEMLNNIARGIAEAGKGTMMQPPKEAAQDENPLSLAYMRLKNGQPIDVVGLNALAAFKPIENPQSLDDYHNSGFFHAMSRNFQAALADFNRAIAIAPDCLYAYVSRGNTYANLGNYEAAMQDYQHVIDRDPNIASVYINRGLLYFHQKKEQAAFANLEKAISLEPDAYFVRAYLYMQLEDYEKALADYNSLIALNPEHASAYAGRANVYNKLGNYQAAMADMMKSQSLSQKNSP